MVHPTPQEIMLQLFNTVDQLTGIRNTSKKQVSKLERVLLIKVSQPPLEKYILFQLFKYVLHFFLSHHPKYASSERPRYSIDKEDTLHSIMVAKFQTLGTFPAAINSDLARFTVRPETASQPQISDVILVSLTEIKGVIYIQKMRNAKSANAPIPNGEFTNATIYSPTQQPLCYEARFSFVKDQSQFLLAIYRISTTPNMGPFTCKTVFKDEKGKYNFSYKTLALMIMTTMS